MTEIKVDDRIAFILKLKEEKKECYFVNYGVYEGQFKPDIDDFIDIKKKKKRRMIENTEFACRFKLDDGTIAWQWQGWWISEDRFKEIFIDDYYKENWQIINVDAKGRRR
jgi:hypothetical protein